MENTRTNTKTHLILKIGMLARKLNPNIEITSKEIEGLRNKSREELRGFIKELEDEIKNKGSHKK